MINSRRKGEKIIIIYVEHKSITLNTRLAIIKTNEQRDKLNEELFVSFSDRHFKREIIFMGFFFAKIDTRIIF